MSTVEEIITAIERLNAEDRAELERRLRWEDDAWDQQIADDFKAGKLDQLIAAAKADAKAGHTRDLP
jgi:hypothetical protein